jgi:allantoinase
LVSGYVARRFRLPRKGRIEPGADADLALVRVDQEWLLRADELHDRHKLTPYASRRFRGRVERTLLRGETIYHDGRFAAMPRGRLLRPTPPLRRA